MSLNAFNFFDDPDKLHSVAFASRIDSGKLFAELTPLSIATIQVEV